MGQDADSFRRGRWLEASPDKLKEMESTLELILSYGKYQCLGKNLAIMELNKIFVEVGGLCDCQVDVILLTWNSF
jgi:hypothetical protein